MRPDWRRIRGSPWRESFGLGASVSVDSVPSTSESAYGGRWPLGFAVFLSTRPGQVDTRPGQMEMR
jgi:hypothetical protein